jgi:hypothetical protein
MAERYRITVRAEGPGPPVEIRIRNFLRGLLRRARLRCTAIEAMDVSDACDRPAQDERQQQQAAHPSPFAVKAQDASERDC